MFVYACKVGQSGRSYGSTQTFIQQLRTQLASSKTLALPSCMRKLKNFGQMYSIINFNSSIEVKVVDLQALEDLKQQPEESNENLIERKQTL